MCAVVSVKMCTETHPVYLLPHCRELIIVFPVRVLQLQVVTVSVMCCIASSLALCYMLQSHQNVFIMYTKILHFRK